MNALHSHCVLALISTALAAPAEAKRVVCIDPRGDAYTSNQEGFERARATAGTDVVSITGSLTDCMAHVVNGDELVIVCHGLGNQALGLQGVGFRWDGQDYLGFGNGPDQMPVPPSFATLTNVTVTICACWSARDPDGAGGPDRSLVDKLQAMLPGDGNRVDGFMNIARPGVDYRRVGGTPAQRAMAKTCLLADNSWMNTAPANRPNTGGGGQPPNQQTSAQAIVDARLGAAGVVTIVIPDQAGTAARPGYYEAIDTTENPPPGTGGGGCACLSSPGCGEAFQSTRDEEVGAFNVDVGEEAPGIAVQPSATYGAAADQPGVWNAIVDGVSGAGTPPTGMPWYTAQLFDLNGTMTNSTTFVMVDPTSNAAGDFQFNNAGTTGDDEWLIDDLEDLGGVGHSAAWTINDVATGVWELFVYAIAPDSSSYLTSIDVSGALSPNPQVCGGPWPGAHILGTTFTNHLLDVTQGFVRFTATTLQGFGSVNGFQLRRVTAGIDAYCAGDGSGTACPCGNVGASGNGCANSVAPSGAGLVAHGTASVSGDTLQLLAFGLPTSSALLFQGTLAVNGGFGAVFGDGLRCAGGTVVRLYTRTSPAGSLQFPGSGHASISSAGSVPASGGFRYYQVWYRNAAAFCTSATFNLTNGVRIYWRS